jgi:hypothetical protein
MAELIRTYPDRDFNRTMYGPEPHDLYKSVKNELLARPGSLSVEVDDKDALVFLNERFEATGGVDKSGLAPGTYRLLIQRGKTPGRVRDVQVSAGAKQSVAVDWGFESALVTSRDHVALSYRDDAERKANEPRHATTLARLVGAPKLAVLTISIHEGRRSIIGAVLSVDTGRPYRTGVLALEPAAPGPTQLRGLARFLALGEPAEGVIVPGEPAPEGAAAPSAEPDRRRSPVWKWAALAGGAAAVAAGVTLIALDGPKIEDDMRQPEDKGYTIPGIITASAGAALVATGIVLWVLDSRASAPATQAAVVPHEHGFVLTVGGRF